MITFVHCYVITNNCFSNALSITDKQNLKSIFHLSDINNYIVSDFLSFFLPEDKELIRDTVPANKFYEMYTTVLKTFNIQIDSEISNDISLTLFYYINRFYINSNLVFDIKKFRYNSLRNDYIKSIDTLTHIVETYISNNNLQSSITSSDLCLSIIIFTPNILDSFIDFEDKIDVNLFIISEKSKVELIYNVLTSMFNNFVDFKIIDDENLIKKSEIKDEIWITNVIHLNQDNALYIDAELIYSELIMINTFLQSFKQANNQNK